MIVPTVEYYEHKYTGNYYESPIEEEALLKNGKYKWVSELTEGDVLENGDIVKYIEEKDNHIRIFVNEKGSDVNEES